MQHSLPKLLMFLFVSLGMFGCGSASVENTAAIGSATPSVPTYWSAAVPDFSANPNAPRIELQGPSIVWLAVDEEYVEYGATATDYQGNDISNDISITNLWRRSPVGDYFVRYQVSDSNGNKSREKVRIIRVYDDTPASMMLRPIGSTESHLGYIESLPREFGNDEEKQYALLIFNHGNGANVEVSGLDPVAALQTVIRGTGPALMQQNGKWDTNLPMVTLSPQMGGIGGGNELKRLNAFIDYAVTTYNIDESRIYVTGWSQGGFLSLLYASEYPQRVAAAVSISGGLPLDADRYVSDVCNIDSVPVWLFHGDSDTVVDVESSINTVDYYLQNCQPINFPRLTVFEGQGHVIQTPVYVLKAMQNGIQNYSADPNYQQYDISLFDWLLQYQNL